MPIINEEVEEKTRKVQIQRSIAVIIIGLDLLFVIATAANPEILDNVIAEYSAVALVLVLFAVGIGTLIVTVED